MTKRGKQKWRVGDLLADERCSPAVLDFLRSTYVGRAAPPVEENWDSDEEEEQRAVTAAGVMGEEEEPARSSDPRAPGILFPLFLSLYHSPLSGFAFLGHFLGALISFVTLFW